jgi:hypothetical protein
MVDKEGHGMTITLDIAPEVQAELARQAAAQGRGLEAHAARLLEEAVHHPSAASRHKRPPGRKSLVELFEPLRGLFKDEEIDALFSRNKSTGRPVDLS